jgi:hypothetical protein
MWTQAQIDEIVKALWHLPADKLLEVKNFVLSLKQQYGYEQPVDCSDEWTDQDRRDFTLASMQNLEEQDPTEEENGV